MVELSPSLLYSLFFCQKSNDVSLIFTKVQQEKAPNSKVTHCLTEDARGQGGGLECRGHLALALTLGRRLHVGHATRLLAERQSLLTRHGSLTLLAQLVADVDIISEIRRQNASRYDGLTMMYVCGEHHHQIDDQSAQTL